VDLFGNSRNYDEMETSHLLEEISSKLTLIHEDLRQLIHLNGTNDENISSISNIFNSLEKVLRNTEINADKQLSPQIHESQNRIAQQTINAKRTILQTWARLLNERKQHFWNYLRFQNTAVIYETWLGKEDPVLPRKFQVKQIPGEHQEDIFIRTENALRNFEVEIKLLKNKANRHEKKYTDVDKHTNEILISKFNNQILESLQQLWTEECRKEEEKSIGIWEKKQLWFDNYEEKYGTVDSFIPVLKKPKKHEKSGYQKFPTMKYNNNRNYNIDRNMYQSNRPETRQKTYHHQVHEHHRNPNSNFRKENANHQRSGRNRFRNTNFTKGYFHRNGTTYIGKNVKKHFLGRGVSDKGGGTQDNVQILQTASRQQSPENMFFDQQTRVKVIA